MSIRTQGLGGVNLLAKSFADSSRQRVLMKRWTKGLILYVLLLGGLAAALFGGDSNRDELRGTSETLETKLTSRKRELSEQSGRASVLRKQLRAAEAVGQHPLWGQVFAVVAAKASGRVVLSGLSLTVNEPPRASEAAASGGAKTQGTKNTLNARTAVIVVNGRARGLSEVNEYVLALEDLGVFDQVRLKDATNVDSGTGPVTTRFEVVCKVEQRRLGGKP